MEEQQVQTEIAFKVRFLCGCEKTILTTIDVPKSFADAYRSDENDERIIEYLKNNYDLTRLHCDKKHRFMPTGFDRIIEIL